MDNVYAVYDSCSGVFGDPFIATNNAVAKRTFEYALANPSLPKYIRDDSVLYSLGTYDRETGYFSVSAPSVVTRGSSVVLTADLTADWNENSVDSEVNHNEK